MNATIAAHWIAAALALALLPAGAMAEVETAYQAGVSARLSGNPARAKILLEQWLAQHPGDVDAQLQLAYADLALGNLDEAEAGFRAVLSAAPQYADASTGLDRVRERRATVPEDNGARIAIEGALSDLSGGGPGWREAAIDVDVPFGQTALGARAAHYRRFGLDDTELGARIGLHPADNLWLRLHAGTTPNADFRPEFEIGGGADLRLAGSGRTVLTIDGAFQRFPLQDVVSINPGLVQYLSDGRTWLSLRGIGTVADGGPIEVGGMVRIDHAPKDRWRLFTGAANGPDTDLGVVTRVNALFGGFEAPLGKRASVGGSLSREWRDAGSDRTEFRLTLKTRL